MTPDQYDDLIAVGPAEATRQREFFRDLSIERVRQLAKWGDQRHPDGTGLLGSQSNAAAARIHTERAAANGEVTWQHILTEEVFEAFAEHDPAKLRAELVQCGAVIAAWISDIDRRPQ